MYRNGLRLRREAAHLSREKLARAANVSLSLITNMERGYRPSEPTALRIAAVLDCEPVDLFEEIEA